MLTVRALLLVCAFFVLQCDSAKILGLFTRFSRSHLIIHLSVAKSLIDEGHDVTLVTTVPLQYKNPNFTHILLSPFEIDIKGVERLYNFTRYQYIDLYYKPVVHITNMQYNALKSFEFQELLNTSKFDLLLLGYSMNDFQLVVAAQLRIPVILSWVQAPDSPINTYVGNPKEVSYVPTVLSGLLQPMNFRQRFHNLLRHWFSYAVEKYWFHKHAQFYK